MPGPLPDADALQHLYLFRHVPRSALRELCILAPPTRFDVGTTLFRQGDAADVALLLVQGRLIATVRVRDLMREVGDVRPGEIVGETALFDPNGRRSATVVAATDSSALIVSWYLLERAADNPAVVALERHLLGTMARRIRKTNQNIQAEWRAVAALTPEEAPKAPTLRERLRALFGGGA